MRITWPLALLLAGCLDLPGGELGDAAPLADAAPADAFALPLAAACVQAPVEAPVVAEGAPLARAYHAACPPESGPVPAPFESGRLSRLLPSKDVRDVNCDGYTDLLLLDAGDSTCRGVKLVPGGPGGPRPDNSNCLTPRLADDPDPDTFRAFVAADLASGRGDGFLDLLALAAPLSGEGEWRFLGKAGYLSDFGGFFESTKRGPASGLDTIFGGDPERVFLQVGATAEGPVAVFGAGAHVGFYQDDGTAESWESQPVEVREIPGVLGAFLLPGGGGRAWFMGRTGGLLIGPEEAPIPWAPRGAGPAERATLGGEDGLVVADGPGYVFLRAGGTVVARVGQPEADAVDFEVLATGDLGGEASPDLVLVDVDSDPPRGVIDLDPTCAPGRLVASRRLRFSLPDTLRPLGAAIGRFSGPTPEVLFFTADGRLLRYHLVGERLEASP